MFKMSKKELLSLLGVVISAAAGAVFDQYMKKAMIKEEVKKYLEDNYKVTKK